MLHRFTYLVEGCVAFMGSRIEQTRSEIEGQMQDKATSVHIKNLQSLSLQYAVTAVGIFSIFDAEMQRELSVDDGFRGVRDLLKEEDLTDLAKRFELFALAVNVLKHGSGRSYERLCKEGGDLPFKVRLQEDDFFTEGDCSEIDTLVLADLKFVQDCAHIVHEVSEIAYKRVYGQ
jgi:hypothetical protein|tara:strand:- start:96 stop:620 length:525 start_codon:yes stop_codon:yes gene_type:complete